MAHTVLSATEAQGEIGRYISWQGQAPSYVIGRRETTRLRSQAQQGLGDKFDIREFHDHVLENGCVPLGFLRTTIAAWTASRRAAADGKQ